MSLESILTLTHVKKMIAKTPDRIENRNQLSELIVDAIRLNKSGMTHAQLVRTILQTGYKHVGDLSSDVMKIVKNLNKCGVIEKNLETRKISVAN